MVMLKLQKGTKILIDKLMLRSNAGKSNIVILTLNKAKIFPCIIYTFDNLKIKLLNRTSNVVKKYTLNL